MGNAEADCKEVLAHLYQFIDSEMSEESCDAIRRHLEGCATCKSHATFEIAVKEIVRRSCCGDEAPERLLNDLRARLREV